MASGVNTRIDDLQMVLNQTEDHRQRVLQAAAKNIRVWFIKVRKMKAIYHTLNLCNIDVTQKCLIAEVWCPVTDLDSIQFALRRGTEHSGSTVPSILNRMQTSQTPPPITRPTSSRPASRTSWTPMGSGLTERLTQPRTPSSHSPSCSL